MATFACRLLLLLSGALLLAGTLACRSSAGATAARRPNILFIAVDDLRPELATYGRGWIKSPHIDALAARGLRFDRAYCNVPVCGASRASLLSGLRPDRQRFLDFATRLDEDAPGTISLPLQLRRHGYQTISLGKVYHHQDDDLAAWSIPPWRPANALNDGLDYQTAENQDIYRNHRNAGEKTRGLPYERGQGHDSLYFDGKISFEAVRQLRRLAAGDQPFFLAVGFMKPHLPFNAPQPYWDLYDPTALPIPANTTMPAGAPLQASHSFGELRHYHQIPATGPLVDTALVRTLIHGYAACVSYTDAQIGRVLQELKRLQLDKNTIVVLWGDHGYQLGEHGLWCKHCTFHNALHVPLIIDAPGLPDGQATEALTEYVDLYPTLCELTNTPLPPHLAGRSLLPLLRNPQAPHKTAVFARWQSADAIRTDRFLFTEWFDRQGQVVGRMLYDHDRDPQENVNVAEDPAYTTAVQALHEQLRRHLETQQAGYSE